MTYSLSVVGLTEVLPKLLRWPRFAFRLVGARLGRHSLPFKLTFVITKECHSRCEKCSIWKVKPKGELSLDEIRCFARNSPFLSWLQLTGGEPTDREDFPKIAEAFRESCRGLVLMSFPTNALKPKRVLEMAREIGRRSSPVMHVTVSVDGPPDLHDRLRGIPGNFERAAETYRGLQAIRGIRPHFGMTLYPENVHMIGDTVSALASVVPGFHERDLHLNLPHTSEHYYGNVDSSPQPTEEIVRALGEHTSRRGLPRTPFGIVERVYQRQTSAYVRTGVTPMPCVAVSSSVYLGATGEVYPCSIWNNPLGNIRDHGLSLVPIVEKERTKEIRRRITEHDCPNCWTPCEAYQSILVHAGRSRA